MYYFRKIIHIRKVMVMYKVTVEGPGMNLEREVTPEVGDQVAVMLLKAGIVKDSDPRTAAVAPVVEEAAPQTPVADKQSLSIREYLLNHEPKRMIDKIVAMGAYLTEYRGKKYFSSNDILALFEEAAEKPPGNFARDLKWSRSAGWIAPRQNVKGEYFVTHLGMEAVKANFPPELLEKSKQPRSRKRKIDDV